MTLVLLSGQTHYTSTVVTNGQVPTMRCGAPSLAYCEPLSC
jgi:hypothetical protein